VRLLVPAAGIDTPLPPLRVDPAGALVPPDDVATAGWFSQGPAPGDAGPAVLVGHVDSTAGPGVFFRLRGLRTGDEVVVRRADGSAVRFTVTRVARYPKTAFPSAAVYGPTADPELRLVTCGGAFDRAARSYLDDVVVFATV
jgi:sortase (surface protein transpeptidase)